MNPIVQDYSKISDDILYRHLSFYWADDFSREMIRRKIPDVIQYVQNILWYMLEAHESRQIVEDISARIIEKRKEQHLLIPGTYYPVGSLCLDGRSYAQRNNREWCSYMASINDNVAQIVNIVFEFGHRPWESNLASTVAAQLKKENSIICDSCYKLHKALKPAIDLNNYAKHNLRLWGHEKVTPTAMEKVEYYVFMEGKEISMDSVTSLESEREIARCVTECLDKIFSAEMPGKYQNRRYIAETFLQESSGGTTILENLYDNVDPDTVLQVEFKCEEDIPERQTRIISSKIDIDTVPLPELYLAAIHKFNGLCFDAQNICILACNSIDVYTKNKEIGKYVCVDKKDQEAKYLHFKRFEFRSL